MEKLTPERKKKLEAQLQKTAEILVVEALCDLRDDEEFLRSEARFLDLTVEERELAVVALRDFFDKVAEGLVRNWGLDQSVRVKVLGSPDVDVA